MVNRSEVMKEPALQSKKWWIILFFSIVTSVISTATVYSLFDSKPNQENLSSVSLDTTSPDRDNVSARGRIEPQGEVIRLSASTSLETFKISKVLVEEGETVNENQIIAILDNYDRLSAALTEAQQQVKVAHADLAKVKAGAKTGQIQAQQANILRLQAQLLGERRTQQANLTRLQAQLLGERKRQQANLTRLQAKLRNAQTEFGRFQILYEEGAVEASTFDSKSLEVETAREQLNAVKASLQTTEETLQQQIKEAKASLEMTEEIFQQQINEAKATLNQIAEVRPTDIQAAQVKIDSLMAAVETAKANLELAYVRAPKGGQILQIYALPGEIVGDLGIADMGQTDQMSVVAEVYETDVSKVSIGQQARITSEALIRELRGEVTQVGLQVRQQETFSTNPIADIDRRVVEVKIRLNPEDAKQVRSLTNLQVEVVIHAK